MKLQDLLGQSVKILVGSNKGRVGTIHEVGIDHTRINGPYVWHKVMFSYPDDFETVTRDKFKLMPPDAGH